MERFAPMDPTRTGWHMGINSAVRLAAWIPAIRAAASTSPLVMALFATFVVVSGSIETRQRARARRCVGSRGVTSTMRGPPRGEKVGEDGGGRGGGVSALRGPGPDAPTVFRRVDFGSLKQ